jgi:hypothetical protein
MNCAVVVVAGVMLLHSPPKEPWPPGFIGVLDSDRMTQFDNDVATADFEVSIVNKAGKNEIDIGIADKSFTQSELQRFFKFQRHKDFIVVTYHKNAPNGKLDDSLKEIKTFFGTLGTSEYSSLMVLRRV